MIKHLIILIVLMVISGCVTTKDITSSGQSKPKPIVSSTQTLNPVKKQATRISKDNLTNIRNVYVGMTKSEVQSVMGDELKIGYEFSDISSGSIKSLTVKSPYRTEFFKRKDKEYFVAFYFTHIKKADDIVSEDELTPIVFFNDSMIGKGRDYLFKLKNL